MKRNLYIPVCILSLALCLLQACKPDEKATGSPSPLVSIEDLRAVYKGTPRVLERKDLSGAYQICGIVITDPANGNAPEGLVVVQGYKRKRLRGIALALGSAASKYQAGDSVVVKVEGATLDRRSGVLQVVGLEESAVAKISSGNEQKIHAAFTTFSGIANQIDIYESTLVQLKAAVVQDMPLGLKFAGDVSLSDWSNVIRMQTNPNAAFANEFVPGLGDYTGIVSLNEQQQPTFRMRSSKDYVGQSLQPYRPGQLYLNFPEGWENHGGTRKSGYAGNTDVFPSGEWLMANMYSLNSVNIVNKNGTWAIMMRNANTATLAMNFNLPYGARKFSFIYGAATASATDAALPINVKVEYSQDSGNTWTALGPDLVVTSQSTKYFREYDLDLKGPVRFRISKDASAARLFVDDVAVYQN